MSEEDRALEVLSKQGRSMEPTTLGAWGLIVS